MCFFWSRRLGEWERDVWVFLPCCCCSATLLHLLSPHSWCHQDWALSALQHPICPPCLFSSFSFIPFPGWLHSATIDGGNRDKQWATSRTFLSKVVSALTPLGGFKAKFVLDASRPVPAWHLTRSFRDVTHVLHVPFNITKTVLTSPVKKWAEPSLVSVGEVQPWILLEKELDSVGHVPPVQLMFSWMSVDEKITQRGHVGIRRWELFPN